MPASLRRWRRVATPMLALALASGFAADAFAGWPRARRVTSAPTVVTVAPRPASVRVVPTSTRAANAVAPSPMLGNFYPEATVNIRGNFTAGGGYSPLETYGNTAASLYGPMSAFRTTAAPVTTYQRGYNGIVRPQVGTGFSTPNQPALSGVVYPTRANVVNGSQTSTTPPQWDSGINWLDLN